jgi:acyl-CoA thioesterase I
MSLFTLFSCHSDREPAASARPVQPVQKKGTIVAVGDSLTAGYGVSQLEAYPYQLERKLREAGYHWEVVNAGISGETSSGTLSRVDWILKLKPDIVILETGANDGLRGVHPDVTQKNLEQIVAKLEEKNVLVVLAGMQALKNMGGPYRKEFAAMYPSVAQKHGLILMPFFLEQVGGEPDLNLGDGIHPNAKGYQIITENIYPFVVQAIDKKKVSARS